MNWEHNASTGTDCLRVTENGRIVRMNFVDGPLYRAEFWGDFSLDFPLKGKWHKTLDAARKELSQICR